MVELSKVVKVSALRAVSGRSKIDRYVDVCEFLES